MKSTFLTICVGIIALAGCEKGKERKANQETTSLEGTWELRKTSAAMNPTVTTYPPGNGNTLKFNGNSYEAYENGQLKSSGQYSVVPDTTVEENVCLVFPDGRFANRIDYDTAISQSKQFFQIDENKLTITSGCYAYDAGHQLEYEKIQSDNK